MLKKLVASPYPSAARRHPADRPHAARRSRRRLKFERLAERALLAAAGMVVMEGPLDAMDDTATTSARTVLSVPSPGVLANDQGGIADQPDLQVGNAYYVSPSGTASGDGSANQPWSLQAALKSSRVRPGDTIWLRGGVYRGGFVSSINGTAAAPITVAAYPGEHVVIDTYNGVTGSNPNIYFDGSYVHYRGLEVTSSSPAPRITGMSGSWAASIDRGTIIGRGSHNKYINFVVHDLSQGFSFWSTGAGGEIYGSIIYNNGWQGSDRPHGHGIYTQNVNDTKVLRDNIIFGQFQSGIQAYGSEAAPLRGFHIEGNTVFDNRILVGGGSSARNITLEDNYTYDTVVDVGYPWGMVNEDLRMTDNYLSGGVRFLKGWKDVVFTGNTVTHDDVLVQLDTPPGVSPSSYEWDNNSYNFSGGAAFLYQGGRSWDTWRSQLGVDRNSTFDGNGPDGTEIFVRPNQYEAGSGNITVYNWDQKASVAAELSSVLQKGQQYTIHHVFDLFGAPVASGVYDGSPVSLPMTTRTAPDPTGHDEEAPLVLGPEFGVFVVRATGGTAAAKLQVSAFDATSVQGAKVTVRPDGSYTYDPSSSPALQALGADETATDRFTYTVSDGQGGSDKATVTITVTGVNQPPVAAADTYAAGNRQTLNVAATGLLANDSDPDGHPLQVQSVGALKTTLGATVTLRADGGFQYDPSGSATLQGLAQGQKVQDSFRYTLSDGRGGTATAPVTITVTGSATTPSVGALQAEGAGNYVVTLDATGQTVQLYRNGVLLDSRLRTLVTEVIVTGGSGSSDSFTVDLTHGNPIPEGGATWDGLDVAGQDRLALKGGSLDRVAYQFTNDDDHQGNLRLISGASTAELRFRETELITTDTVIGAATVELTRGDDAVLLQSRGAAGVGLSGAGLAELQFTHPTDSLTITGGDGSDRLEIRGSAYQTGGADLLLGAETVVVNATVQTGGGDFRSSGGDFTSSFYSGKIVTDGGDVVLDHDGAVSLGANVLTAGGNFRSAGTQLTSTYYGDIRTGGGQVVLQHSGNVRLGGANLATGGGAFQSTGSGNFDVVHGTMAIDTSGPQTGGDIAIRHDGNVLLSGLNSGGGSVQLDAGGEVQVRHRVQTGGGAFHSAGQDFSSRFYYGEIVTAGGEVRLDHAGQVSLGAGVLTAGGDFHSAGTRLTATYYGDLRTAGGDVVLDHTDVALASRSVATGGGDFQSTGSGRFDFSNWTGVLDTSGDAAAGEILIQHDGAVRLNGVDSGGGAVQLHSAADVQVMRRLLTGGGDFTSSGANFTSAGYYGEIVTAGGNVQLDHQGNVRLGAGVLTAGGDFRSSGGNFLADYYGKLLTGGGDVLVSHTGDVTLYDVITGGGALDVRADGRIQAYGKWDTQAPAGGSAGALLLTLQLGDSNALPLLTSRHPLVFPAGSEVNIKTNGLSAADLAVAPLEVDRLIAYQGSVSGLPQQARVTDAVLGDDRFTASLINQLDRTVDLLIATV